MVWRNHSEQFSSSKYERALCTDNIWATVCVAVGLSFSWEKNVSSDVGCLCRVFFPFFLSFYTWKQLPVKKKNISTKTQINGINQRESGNAVRVNQVLFVAKSNTSHNVNNFFFFFFFARASLTDCSDSEWRPVMCFVHKYLCGSVPIPFLGQ